MLLATEGLNVALATTHIPLEYVAKAITERLHKVIHIINTDLKLKFGVKEPHIYVCGLNLTRVKMVTLALKKFIPSFRRLTN